MLGRNWHRVAIALGIALLGCAGTPARAQTANTTGVSNQRGNGYTVEVTNGWVLGQGYRPIRIDLSAGAVASDDREFKIEVTSHHYNYRSSLTTSEKLVIPAGSRRGSVVISLPHVGLSAQEWVRVYEGGKHLDKLDAYVPASNTWAYQGLLLPSFLYVSDRSLDTALIPEALQLTQGNTNGYNIYANLSMNTVNGRPQYPNDLFTRVLPSELPRRWVDYSSADVVCMSFNDFAGLAKNQPEALRAICEYTTAGGNLWIWDAGPNWERLPEIEQLSGLWGAGAAPWYDPNARDLNKGLDAEFAANRSVDYSMGGGPISQAEDVDSIDDTLRDYQAPAKAPFRLRKAQFGLVLVFSGQQPIGANPPPREDLANWVWAMNSVGADRLLAKKRTGTSMSDDNPDFWNLMIPGVGRAPVTAFRVLITIFVIAIGPVNYFWLRRKRKLHLLLAVVPATALVVTVGLFGYALFTDGLYARVRPRTFTSIDQSRQHAASWARTTYYAGLAPAGGMQFDDDTMILPITPEVNQYGGGARRAHWDGKRQQLTHGWLASRTPTQYLAIRSRPSTYGLRIKPSAPGEAPAITNGLGAAIVHLVVCDENGRLYVANATPRGEACALKAIEVSDDLAEIKRYFASRSAVLMPDMQLTPASYGRGSVFASYAYYGQGSYAPHQQDGRLEESLAIAEGWLRGPISLPPRNYLAIVEQSPEVDYGIESPEQEMPVHVIHGTW